MRRTELDTKSASLASLYNDGNGATRHLVLYKIGSPLAGEQGFAGRKNAPTST